MRKVVIVNAGGWGDLSAEKGSYDNIARSFQDLLSRAKDKDWYTQQEKPAAEVRIVTNNEEALSWLDGRGTVIYLTRGMLREAHKVAEQYPQIRVVLLTGELPEGEVIITGKHWVDSEVLLKMALK